MARIAFIRRFDKLFLALRDTQVIVPLKPYTTVTCRNRGLIQAALYTSLHFISSSTCVYCVSNNDRTVVLNLYVHNQPSSFRSGAPL